MALWPGDIPTQARTFYSSSETIKRVSALAARPGWGLKPNRHFGHFQAGYAWMDVPASVDAYIEFWSTHQDRISTVYRPPHNRGWDELLALLERAGIIDDRRSFEKDFVKTNRNRADVRPGLQLYRVWDLEDATQLDDEGRLVGAVRAAYEQVADDGRLAIVALVSDTTRGPGRVGPVSHNARDSAERLANLAGGRDL